MDDGHGESCRGEPAEICIAQPGFAVETISGCATSASTFGESTRFDISGWVRL